MNSNPILSPPPRRHYLAPWSIFAGGAALAATAAYSVYEAITRTQAIYLLGLIPAVCFFVGLVTLGLREWPRWSKLTAGICILAGSGYFTAVGLALTYNHGWLGANDYFAAAGGAMAGGFGVGVIFLCGGWVYLDARRRGLNAAGWAALAILLCPYLLGFIGYLIFVVLMDRRLATCGGCGSRLSPSLAYCTRCGHKATVTCNQCQHALAPGARFCGKCGAPLAP